MAEVLKYGSLTAELLLFCRTCQRGGAGQASGNKLGHFVKITGSHFPLVANRFIAFRLAGEFRLLQLG